MDNPVLTPERLAAAQDAARQKLLRRTKVAGKPAAPPPPRPPTLKERMRGGGIVPLDELLAHQDEIIAATEREREQIVRRSQREREAYEASRAAFAQQKPAFDELCTIQVQLAQALGYVALGSLVGLVIGVAAARPARRSSCSRIRSSCAAAASRKRSARRRGTSRRRAVSWPPRTAGSTSAT